MCAFNENADLLGAIGMSELQAERYLRCAEAGGTDECLRMLRLRRAELLVALHEAQRPIDMVDYAIRDLQRSAASA